MKPFLTPCTKEARKYVKSFKRASSYSATAQCTKHDWELLEIYKKTAVYQCANCLEMRFIKAGHRHYNKWWKEVIWWLQEKLK